MRATNDAALQKLLSDLKTAGIQKIVPSGDRLRYYPKSAMTPELGQRVRAYKPELLVALSDGTPFAKAHESHSDVLEIRARLCADELQLFCPTSEVRDAIEKNRGQLETLIKEMCDTATENDWPGRSVDPGRPCATCGLLDKSWDILGGEHCQKCERDKILRSQRIARRAAQLRKIHRN